MFTIGLFGTCGGSTWRDRFIAAYDLVGYSYFNPQVDNWSPELALVEAEHLANDDIILFPVTGETAGIGSLAEIGFAVNQARASLAQQGPWPRQFMFMIDAAVTADVDPVLAKESNRARKLVLAHLHKAAADQPNVHIADNLNDLLIDSIDLATETAAKMREAW